MLAVALISALDAEGDCYGCFGHAASLSVRGGSRWNRGRIQVPGCRTFAAVRD